MSYSYRYKKLYDQKETHPNILVRLKKTKHINEEEWNELYTVVDAMHSNYTIRLLQKHPSLTEKDIRLATLLRLGYGTVDLQEILCLEEDSLYKSKKRLRNRLDKNRMWNKGELEEFLSSF